MLFEQRPVGPDRATKVVLLLRLLPNIVQLLCAATDLLIPWRDELDLFFVVWPEDYRGSAYLAKSETDCHQGKEKGDSKLHRVSQGNELLGSVKLTGPWNRAHPQLNP